MNKFNRNLDGFVPSVLLRDVAARTELLAPALTIPFTQKLWLASPARRSELHRFLNSNGKSRKEIYDAEHNESLPGKRARFEEDAVSSDKLVNNSFDFFLGIDKYYREVHGRNSYDANGATWKGVVHFGVDYDNAYWNSSEMVAGDGDGKIFSTFVDFNVWAHELGHAVTEYAVPGGIEYYGQSGAINEHLSDVSASNAESWNFGKVLPSQFHWLIGKSIFVPLSDTKGGKYWRKALRDMHFPGTAYNDPELGKDRQPADMDHYVKTSSDNGGVHTNSGIPNRLYCLFALGIEQAGLGNDWNGTFGRAARIWYAARPNLGNRPSFAQLAYWTREACAVETDAETKCREVLDAALAAVKVKPNKKAVDDLTPVATDENGQES